jgi:hypothetical protein
MAKPKTKADLLAQCHKERDALLALLITGSPEELMDARGWWSAKDIVAHLIDWERMLFGWYEAGLRGEKPDVPAKGYTWAKMDQLNERLYRQHRDDLLDTVMSDWGDSSLKLIDLIEKASESDLFTKNRYAWTGRGALVDWIMPCGPAHWAWARKEIKKGRKLTRAKPA